MRLRPLAACLMFFGLFAGAGVFAPAGSIAQTESASPYGGGDPERGKQIFANNGCGWCHEGSGRRAGRGPQLMNTTRSDEFLANRIALGSPGRMPAFGPSLDDQKLRTSMTTNESVFSVGAKQLARDHSQIEAVDLLGVLRDLIAFIHAIKPEGA